MAEQHTWDELAPARRARIAYWLRAVDSEATLAEVEIKLAEQPAYRALAARWDDLSEHERVSTGARQLDELFKQAAYATRPYCRRCGTCCRKAGPTLYPGDESLLAAGIISPTQLRTLRAGERVFSHFVDQPVALEHECVSIIPKAGASCCFLRGPEHRCDIYEHRPRQCRLQRCWDPTEAEQLMAKPGLTRRQLLALDDPVVATIREHDELCSPARLLELAVATRAEQPTAAPQLVELIKADRLTRQQLLRTRLATEATLAFLLGRPLEAMLQPWGLQVIEQDDGQVIIEHKRA